MFMFLMVVLRLTEFVYSVSWFDGTYCLPMPANGYCPNGWQKGWRKHDCEDVRTANLKEGHVPSLPVFGKDIDWGFCCKVNRYSSLFEEAKLLWPQGRYCIMRKGGSCPSGFKQGSIFWDDEDTENANGIKGTLPDGTYNENTKIYFCCRNDGGLLGFLNILQGFPKCRALMLLRYGGFCPDVLGYSEPHEGFVRWDTEDSGNEDRKIGAFPDGLNVQSFVGLTISFCSYTSKERC